MQKSRNTDSASPHPVHTAEVVIIGGGFGGIEVARRLGRLGIHTLLVDQRNHHLFQPLLYQVATAALSATDIAEPIRKILRHQETVRVLLGTVTAIHPESRTVTLEDESHLQYRYLVLASGATHSYFGHGEWAEWAPGLKSIEDARRIRSRLLVTFEDAERAHDAAEQRRLLTIVIVGGGPTGVELAGSIAELCRFALARDFRAVDPGSARVLLVEGGHRLLAGFSEASSTYAAEQLRRLGVEVLIGRSVTTIGPSSVVLGSEEVPVGLVIWAAGVSASPLAAQLGETDRAGRLHVEADLRVAGMRDVFAIGDVARVSGADGATLPGLAQVAKQQGIHLGSALAAYIRNREPIPPFRYRSRGNTAIVGRHKAIYEYRGRRLKGWPAWATWAVVHVYLLVGFEHRVLVAMQWLWRYLTYERGARIIVKDEGAGKPL